MRLPSTFVPVVYRGCLLLAALAGFLTRGLATPTNIFSTQFEFAQGYTTNLDLAGQNGWIKYGTGGNGLVPNFIAGQGQQAYVGFSPPSGIDSALFLLRPINFSPVAAGLPLVRFSTLMQIVDSTPTNNQFDFFQWSVYNIAGNRLFTLDFDNFSTNISYALDGTNSYVSTGVKFAPGANYTLTITMNFASNRWSATLNSFLLATNLPMTTTGLPITLGDVDAVWDVYDTNSPGDNFMLFDNYTLTAEALPTTQPAQPRLTLLGRSGGQTSLRLTGQSGSKFAIEASTNFVNWTALKTNLVSDGTFDYVDSSASALARRLYRARWVP